MKTYELVGREDKPLVTLLLTVTARKDLEFLPSSLYYTWLRYTEDFLSLILICITDTFNFSVDPINFLKVFGIIKLHFMMTGNAILPRGTCLGVGTVNIKVCIHSDVKLKLVQKD